MEMGEFLNRCLKYFKWFFSYPPMMKVHMALKDIGTLKCIEYDKDDRSCNQPRKPINLKPMNKAMRVASGSKPILEERTFGSIN